MDRNSVNWRGYIPALTTPFTAAGELDLQGWRELVEWAVGEGMHGIVVAGSSGEWFTLDHDERVKLFELATELVAGRIPVIGCCNALRPAESLALGLAAQRIGMDGIILAPPPYAVPNDREVLAFYERIATQVHLPLCLYNWPRGTGVDMARPLVERLAEIDTVVAIKNSTGSFAGFIDTFFACKDRIRIFGFGYDELALSLIRDHGGDGTIGGGAMLGREHPAFFEAIWAGNLETARRHAAREKRVFDFCMAADFAPRFASAQAIMKALLNLQGLPGGYPRQPLLPLTREEAERVRTLLDELGLSPCDATADNDSLMPDTSLAGHDRKEEK
jgi:dihydrodipicolinate synthase/N-acetylneuraminate lyase